MCASFARQGSAFRREIILTHMAIQNFEFKARAADLEILEKKLLELNPRYIGEDNQVDTYFNVTIGRLKIREGNIENALIHYMRPNTEGAKPSEVLLFKYTPDQALKDILTKTLGVKVVVRKQRKIYFIKNVKFHFDKVMNLGNFVEVEAIDDKGTFETHELQKQCLDYATFLDIQKPDFVAESYSDMLLAKAEANSPQDTSGQGE